MYSLVIIVEQQGTRSFLKLINVDKYQRENIKLAIKSGVLNEIPTDAILIMENHTGRPHVPNIFATYENRSFREMFFSQYLQTQSTLESGVTLCSPSNSTPVYVARSMVNEEFGLFVIGKLTYCIALKGEKPISYLVVDDLKLTINGNLSLYIWYFL